MQIVFFFLSIFIAWYLGKKSEERIKNEIQKLYNSRDQLTEDIQSGRRNNYVEKTYSGITVEKQKKAIILSAFVANKIKEAQGELQKEIEKVLRLLAEGVYSLPRVKRIFKSKFYMYRIGKYRLIFEERKDKILIVDFDKRGAL